jgi:hypothetical protein
VPRETGFAVPSDQGTTGIFVAGRYGPDLRVVIFSHAGIWGRTLAFRSGKIPGAVWAFATRCSGGGYCSVSYTCFRDWTNAKVLNLVSFRIHSENTPVSGGMLWRLDCGPQIGETLPGGGS